MGPAERKLQAGIKGPAGKRSAADMQKRGGPKELDRAKPSDDASGSSSDEEESRTSTFKRKPSRTAVRQAPLPAPAASRPEVTTTAAGQGSAAGATREVSNSRGGSHQRPPMSEAAAVEPPLALGHPPSKKH